MIHNFRLGTGAVTVVSALALAGLASGPPALARAADGQPVPVQPRVQPVPQAKHPAPKAPAAHKRKKARKKRGAVRRPVELARPEVRLDVGGPEGPLIPGRTYDWPYSLTNIGKKRAEMVTFIAPVPSGLEYVSGQGNCSMQSGDVVCLLGALDEGKTVNGVVTTKVAESARPDSTVTGPAGVSWDGGSAPGAFPAKSVSPASDLAVNTSGPNQLRPGQQIVYTLTIENRGPSPATGVTASTPDAPAVPAGTPASTPSTPLQVAGAKGCAKQGGDGLVCELGTLKSHESKTFNVIFKAPPRARPGVVFVKRFEVTSATPDLRPQDNYSVVRPRVTRFLPARDQTPPRPMPHLPQDAAPVAAPRHGTVVNIPAPAPEALPETGSDTQSRIDLALALLGVGLVLVGVGTRRRRASA